MAALALARAGFTLVQKNSGAILTTIGLGSAAEMAWDWVFGPSYSQQEQQDLVAELQTVRSQLAEPGLEPEEAMKLAQRDSEIQDALADLGIEVRADFQSAQDTQSIQQNAANAGMSFSAERPNVTMADTRLLLEVKKAMGTIASQFGGPKGSLPDTIAALRLLMTFDDDQLNQLGNLIYRLDV